MEAVNTFVASNQQFLIGTAAIICGVALFYLLMSRTLKRRNSSDD